MASRLGALHCGHDTLFTKTRLGAPSFTGAALSILVPLSTPLSTPAPPAARPGSSGRQR